MSISSSGQPNGEVNRTVVEVLKFTGAFASLVSFLLAWFGEKAWAFSYLAGTLVSVLNFLLLKIQLDWMVKRMHSNTVMLSVVLGYGGRLLLMGLFLFWIGHYGIAHLLSAGFGLLAVRIGIFMYGIKGDF